MTARASAHGRRRVLALAAVAAVLACSAALVLVMRAWPGPDRLDIAQTTPVDRAPAGATVEPTPYAVPTSAPGHENPNPFLGDIASGGRSVPWRLTRLWDGGQRLEVEHDVSCGERPDVRVRESGNWVLIQALGYEANKACASAPTRVQVTLRTPLADRQLLHADTGELGDPVDPRTLADRWADSPAWPGEPWYRDGSPRGLDELVLSEGPEHCSWERASVLAGRALGADNKLYWRDPHGVLQHEPTVSREFQARASLPQDATWTGWTQQGAELWTGPSTAGRYVYLVRSADRSDVERWVAGAGGCA